MRLDKACESNAKLIIDVIDTGIGMSEEQTGMLFQPFSQVDGSAGRRFGGSGLGLVISKRLAGLLGGDILVSSIPGIGSTFSVAVSTGSLHDVTDFASSSDSVDQPKPPTNTWQKLDCHILLAEDGPDNQRLITFLLHKAGAKVTVAENGQIALDLALKAQQAGHPFEMILLDMQMPVMDGYEAARMLHTVGYRGPIIALTAHAMSDDRQKCLDAGCDDYISKPVDPKKLLAILETWVDTSSPV